MNKEVITHSLVESDAFTAELERAADEILNHLSNAELDSLLSGEDRTFRNQETPMGESLVGSGAAPKGTVVYSWGNLAATTRFYVSVGGDSNVYFVPSPEQAADRQDLALAA